LVAQTRLSRKPQTWRYAWDSESRLTSVVTPDGTLWNYRYDPLGRRIAKQRLADDGETVLEETCFTWDGMVLCEQRVATTSLSIVPGY
jgi:YD repeat-containing protein